MVLLSVPGRRYRDLFYKEKHFPHQTNALLPLLENRKTLSQWIMYEYKNWMRPKEKTQSKFGTELQQLILS